MTQPHRNGSHTGGNGHHGEDGPHAEAGHNGAPHDDARPWSGRRVLLTGAAGFIGSHVARGAAVRGADIVGLDLYDDFYPRALKEANVRAAAHIARVVGRSFTVIEGDACDPATVARAMAGCTSVIHLAGRAGVRPSLADPPAYARANVLATSVVLEAARAAGVDRVIVASSSSVYGNQPEVPFSESAPCIEPISPYAATKRAAELLAHTHHLVTGMPTGVLRFFTVYGPGQRPDLAISRFLTRIGAGEPIQMFGDGSTSRDYTFVDDIVEGVLRAHDRIPDFGYRTWNLGSDRPTTLAELIGTIERVVGREARIDRAPMQPGDVERTWADLTRSRTELGYEPRTTLLAGIRRQWASVREQAAEVVIASRGGSVVA